MATPIPTNSATFTHEAVAEATGGTLRRGDPAGEVRGIVIDSRAVTPGCLFIALRGENHDAHRFVEDAVKAGAAAVLVDSRGRLPEGLDAAVIEVEDTTRALGDLGRAHRRAWEGTVVAITGSAGKTSTKELTAAALTSAGGKVHRTRGNLNNLFGVPMTLFELEASHDLAVVEVGTSRPGEIARLADIARPDVGVVTLVAAAHTEGLGDIDAVGVEKWSLAEAVHAEGTAIVNADDATLRRLAQGGGGGRRVWFGRAPDADVRLLRHGVDDSLHTRAAYAIAGRADELEVELALVGEAAAMNGAAALAVVLSLGLDVEKAAEGLSAVVPGPGRMRPLRAPSGALILDDAYNANPRSVALALDTAADLARKRGGRVIAVLGDMKELGPRSTEEHAAVGRHAAKLGARMLFACGPEMRYAAWTARQTPVGMEVHHFEDPLEAVERVSEEAGKKDVVLVKGSRSMQMERVVGALAEESQIEAVET